MSISILLVDDQPLIRGAVRELVVHEPDLQVAGEAANGREAIDLARRTQPDLVLMDIRMPVMDGLQATREICADPDLSGTRVLILTTFEEEDYVAEALRAGASGFIGKGTEPAELIAAIRTVHAGEALLSPRATRALIDRYVKSTPRTTTLPIEATLEVLTEREREVLVLVAEGLSNGEIATALTISLSTAKTHVNRTMAKLLAHDRAQLVILAYESGLVVAGEA
ncbi:MAG TPA: response regulator transcription factor [Microbacteriaceae bacterium]|nr:response regulator transcription factor [Microbacteriaceae bacterium]